MHDELTPAEMKAVSDLVGKSGYPERDVILLLRRVGVDRMYIAHDLIRAGNSIDEARAMMVRDRDNLLSNPQLRQMLIAGRWVLKAGFAE